MCHWGREKATHLRIFSTSHAPDNLVAVWRAPIDPKVILQIEEEVKVLMVRARETNES